MLRKSFVPIFYNLYFLIVNGKTFRKNLKIYLQEFPKDLSFVEKRVKQLKKKNEIIDLASKKFFFPKDKLYFNSELPGSFITKDFYREHKGIFDKSFFWKKIIETSGSTGIPFRIIRSPKSFINSQISFYLFFQQFNLNRFDRNIYIGGARTNKKMNFFSKFKNYLTLKILNQYKFVSADINSYESYMEFIYFYEKFKPLYIHGFSSALLKIANFIKNENISLNWKPKLIHPTAESISLSQRKILSEVFGAKTKMVYGSTECHMASECDFGEMHLNMENCDIDLTEKNSALLTVFDSVNMPLVNYQIGDILKISLPEKKCGCGKHTFILDEIVGREQDFIKLKNGMKITHPDLNMLIGSLDGKNQIIEYQIVHNLDTEKIEIRLLNEDDFDLRGLSISLNDRFPEASFEANNKEFILLENGKKPVIAKIILSPETRETFKSYKAYEEISDSQKNQSSEDVLKLDWNESTFDFPVDLKTKALSELSKIKLNHYPDLKNKRLKRALSKFLGIDETNLTIFNGSDSGIATICRLFIEKEDSVITINPTYGNYSAIASRYTKNVLNYELEYPFELNFQNFTNFIKEHDPKLIFVTNPNNPTGVTLDKTKLFDLVKDFKTTCFVIDEAYAEFNEENQTLAEFPSNMIILRTFSKAWGLAGIRLGYSISSDELSKKLSLSRDNKEVDVFAQIIGSIALENPDYMKNYIAEVASSKKMLEAYFSRNDIPFLSGSGNFILFKVENPNEIETKLKERQIFIRNRTNEKNLQGFLRLTVGDTQTMNKFTEALSEVIEKDNKT